MSVIQERVDVQFVTKLCLCQLLVLTEHANGVKHNDALDKRQNFF